MAHTEVAPSRLLPPENTRSGRYYHIERDRKEYKKNTELSDNLDLRRSRGWHFDLDFFILFHGYWSAAIGPSPGET